MRFFANLFLMLFLADGGVSLLHELVSRITPATTLSGVRDLLAGTVLLMAIPLYISLGIDRRLPKRLFLPLIIFVFWCPLSTWLCPPLEGSRIYGVLVAAGQVILGLLPLLLLKDGTGRSFTLPPALFGAPFFSRKNTVIFGLISVFLVPLTLLMFLLSAANSFMVEYSAGFMRLGPGGLHMIERVYRRDNRTIRLAGMIHVGEKRYYDDLAGSLATGRTIILAEGVTDDGNLLRNRFDYRKVAGALGLTPQEKMLFPGRLIDEAELEAPRHHPVGTGDTGSTDVFRADLDMGDFRPPTILLLNAIGRHMTESGSMVQAFRSLAHWAETNITPEMQEIITDDILHRRNREVLSHLDAALERYDTVVIPWGALHMKEIEQEILERGFQLQEERERTSIDFKRKLPWISHYPGLTAPLSARGGVGS